MKIIILMKLNYSFVILPLIKIEDSSPGVLILLLVMEVTGLSMRTFPGAIGMK